MGDSQSSYPYFEFKSSVTGCANFWKLPHSKPVSVKRQQNIKVWCVCDEHFLVSSILLLCQEE